MSAAIIRNPEGFKYGYTPIISIDDGRGAVGMNFGILRCKTGEEKELSSGYESAYLLIDGKVTFEYDHKTYEAERHSIFEENPIAIHFAEGAQVRLKPSRETELAVFQVANVNKFPTRVFDAKNMQECQRRGQGILDDTSYRIVRTIFDTRNRPEAKLVLGEDINFPGRWSSYPPHHHPQPEIYHYRFNKPQGYGHAELGEEVYKVHNYDTLKILDQKDHPQVAAPGYTMYYLWAIRHLEGNPYIAPEYTQEHRWVLNQ